MWPALARVCIESKVCSFQPKSPDCSVLSSTSSLFLPHSTAGENLWPLADVRTSIQLALYICGFHIHRFNKLQIENNRKKIPESSKRQNLNVPHPSNYVCNVYIVLSTINNLEMILVSTGGPGTNSPQILKDDYNEHITSPWIFHDPKINIYCFKILILGTHFIRMPKGVCNFRMTQAHILLRWVPEARGLYAWPASTKKMKILLSTSAVCSSTLSTTVKAVGAGRLLKPNAAQCILVWKGTSFLRRDDAGSCVWEGAPVSQSRPVIKNCRCQTDVQFGITGEKKSHQGLEPQNLF